MIGTWHHVIGGFRQGRRHPHGNETLWLKLRALSDRSTSVQIWDWDTDWDAIAAFVMRTSRPAPVINVYAYSWGGGWGFTRFAAGLRARGLTIRHAVLSDAVYRSRWLPDWLPANPLSLMRWPAIEVPDNVREVHWFHQNVSRPAGHRLTAASPDKTRVHPGVLLNVPHAAMDEAARYHHMAWRLATGDAPLNNHA